jgi:hypothetical protein
MKPPAHVPSTKALADQHTRYHLKQAPMISREPSESRKRRLDFDDAGAKSGRPVAPHSKSLKRDDSFRKDMYLTFVKNALKERTRVSYLFLICMCATYASAQLGSGKLGALS